MAVTPERDPPPAKPSVPWWPYFILGVIMFVLGMVTMITGGLGDSYVIALLLATMTMVDLFSLVGLYGYIRAMPIGAPPLWRIVLTLVVAKLLVGASFFIPNLFPWQGEREQYVALVSLGSMLLAAPLIAALWLYAFRSPQVWREA